MTTATTMLLMDPALPATPDTLFRKVFACQSTLFARPSMPTEAVLLAILRISSTKETVFLFQNLQTFSSTTPNVALRNSLNSRPHKLPIENDFIRFMLIFQILPYHHHLNFSSLFISPSFTCSFTEDFFLVEQMYIFNL